jgi:hypothetical protein
METGPDFFLEVLCLAIYCDDIETEKIIISVLNTYYDEIKSGSSLNDDLTKFYIKLINDLTQNKIDLNNGAEIETFLLKFEQHPIIKNNPKILKRIVNIIANRKSVTSQMIYNLKTKIKKWIVWVNGNNNLKKLFKTSQKVISTTDTIIQDALMGELLDRARDLTRTYENNIIGKDAHIDFIDMTCPESLKRGLDSYKLKRIDAGYKLGLQGLNRMFGTSGGPVPGEFLAFAGLSHHYKSGILMDIARWIAIYNEPRPRNNKPCAIVFISLENEIYENMMMWFKSAYKNYYGDIPDNMTENEIIEKTSELYKARGFKLLVYRKEGELFGYEEWRNLHDELSEKYTICCSITDYMGLMKLPEDGKENSAKLRQELISKAKNYCNRNSILGCTVLQLDAEAERIVASGVTNAVNKFSASNLSDCKSAKKEVDFLGFICIEKNHLGEAYLTIKWAKHKYNNSPDSVKYCAYKFEEGIGIPDDINGEDKSVKDIYSVEQKTSNKQANSVF